MLEATCCRARSCELWELGLKVFSSTPLILSPLRFGPAAAPKGSGPHSPNSRHIAFTSHRKASAKTKLDQTMYTTSETWVAMRREVSHTWHPIVEKNIDPHAENCPKRFTHDLGKEAVRGSAKESSVSATTSMDILWYSELGDTTQKQTHTHTHRLRVTTPKRLAGAVFSHHSSHASFSPLFRKRHFRRYVQVAHLKSSFVGSGLVSGPLPPASSASCNRVHDRTLVVRACTHRVAPCGVKNILIQTSTSCGNADAYKGCKPRAHGNSLRRQRLDLSGMGWVC